MGCGFTRTGARTRGLSGPLKDRSLPAPQNRGSLCRGLTWVQSRICTIQMVSTTHCSLKSVSLKTPPGQKVHSRDRGGVRRVRHPDPVLGSTGSCFLSLTFSQTLEARKVERGFNLSSWAFGSCSCVLACSARSSYLPHCSASDFIITRCENNSFTETA